MYVVASCKLDKNLERVIAEIEYHNIDRKDILALPLARKVEQKTEKSYHQKSFEILPIAGTILALFGMIYGFLLEWGPIIWGLIGLAIGVSLGGVIDVIRLKKTRDNRMQKEKESLTEVFLMIHCSNKTQAQEVKTLIWKWSPAGVATYTKQAEGGIIDQH